jgi:prepilin-type N-terminal cleavage/methylation domain-containing protein
MTIWSSGEYNMLHNPLKISNSGFTLVEVLITMAIASISFAAIYSVFGSAQKTSTINEVNANVMRSLRTSIDFMESDIRMAGLLCDINSKQPVSKSVIEATSIRLRFTADRDCDGSIEAFNPAHITGGLQESDFEQITYFYDLTSKEIRQCLYDTGNVEFCETLADHVEFFSFTYLDEDKITIADATTNKADIRFVDVSIRIEQPSGLSEPVSRNITKRIFCRNLASEML